MMYNLMNCDEYGCDVLYAADTYNEVVEVAEDFDYPDSDLEIEEINNA